MEEVLFLFRIRSSQKVLEILRDSVTVYHLLQELRVIGKTTSHYKILDKLGQGQTLPTD